MTEQTNNMTIVPKPEPANQAKGGLMQGARPLLSFRNRKRRKTRALLFQLLTTTRPRAEYSRTGSVVPKASVAPGRTAAAKRRWPRCPRKNRPSS